MTLKEFACRSKKTIDEGHKEKTVKAHEFHQKHVLSVLGEREMENLEDKDFSAFYSLLIQAGYSVNTLAGIQTYISDLIRVYEKETHRAIPFQGTRKYLRTLIRKHHEQYFLFY